jgi:hypothetical protein
VRLLSGTAKSAKCGDWLLGTLILRKEIMSYSFSVKAATKAEAKEAVAKYFDEQVIAHQPVHARDRAAVIANADAIIDLLADDETKDIHVSCNGYVSWGVHGEPAEVPLYTAAIAASASHVNRE